MTSISYISRITSLASDSAARLMAVGEPLLRVMTFSPADDAISSKKILCVSIENTELSVAYGSRLFSKVRISGCKRYPTENGRYHQPEAFGFNVAQAASELGALKTEATLSVPKAWAIIRTAEVPVTFKENLPDAILFELDRLTPFKPEDIYYDFMVLKEEANKLTLLLVAVKKDLINPYLGALREQGFNVTRITANLSGLGALCHYMEPLTDSIFIDIDEKGYEGALFRKGAIENVFAGEFEAGEDQAKIDLIMTDIASFKKSGYTLRLMLLLRDNNPAFKEILKLRLGLPVTILNETAINLVSGDGVDLSYAAIGGVLEALWPKIKGMNLLKKGRYEELKPPMAVTFVLAFAVVAILLFYMAAPLWIEGERVKEIDRQIALRKEEVRKIEALKNESNSIEAEIRTIDSFRENRTMFLNILKELTVILPKTTWLSRVKSTETTVEIEGYASSATELLPRLEASKYFKKAEFATNTFRDARMNADRFTIKMEIEGAKKEEVKKEVTGGSKVGKK